ncbi:alpha/beta-hydrolase [Periconia macrospinosa]|uniref:1-alkyl-2-acetylglycerophosphocholine esterase n=1 Tax=Periconia macrospinosa TaxID=97972 RepID=A0A2V1DW59_9PLEO|nr:alpha/beta-hydrolase [Periconia macrospinosa]
MQPSLSILLPLLLTTSAVAYLLPSPPGHYNVTLTTGPLIDSSRKNWALMVSIFQPAKCASTVAIPNMPEKSAKYQAAFLSRAFNTTAWDIESLFLQAQLPVCEGNSSTTALVKNTPVLIFSHGFGGTRLWHNVVASALASEGFTVITTDHPTDTNFIEYPDGHEIINNATSTTPEELVETVKTRAADASFIIDQLSNATAMAALGLSPFPTDRVAILGHSLGGATAILATAQDPRIRAAINWDGSLWNPLPTAGISQPVSFVASEHPSEVTWEEAWPRLNGPKLWTKIAGLIHQGFIEVKMMLKASGQDFNVFPEFLGTIDPGEMQDILVAYTTEWMNGAFAEKVGGPLLEGEQPDRFPAVSVVRKENY